MAAKCKTYKMWWLGFFIAFPLFFLGIPKAFISMG